MFDFSSWFDGSNSGDGSSVTVSDPGSSWGDATPIAPTWDTSSDSSGSYDNGYGGSTQVYPDPGSPTGYSDINGNQVDSTGQPVNYDSSGQLIDSNGNVIQEAGTYQPSSQDQTITPGGYDSNGNPLDANGNPIQRGQQGGTQQGGSQNKGILSSLTGGNSSDSSGGSGLLGTLGMLAAGAGAGYLLSNLLSNKSSSGTSSVAPAHAADIAQGNLTNTPLASSGTNPGYAMGAPVAPPKLLNTGLGHLTSPGSIQTINPQTMTPTGSLPVQVPQIPKVA